MAKSKRKPPSRRDTDGDEAVLKALAKHPLGADGRTVAAELGQADHGPVHEALGRLCKQEGDAPAYVRRAGGLYVLSPMGAKAALHGLSQSDQPTPRSKLEPHPESEPEPIS